MYDALVVGLGPVGGVLAARLAAHGRSVLVVERAAAPYPLPRAVAADDEVQLLLALTAPGLLAGALEDRRVRFLSARGRALGGVDFRRGAGGRSGLAFFHQPTLERRLRAHLAGCEGVEVRLGTAVERWSQDGGGVTAKLSDGAAVRAGWLVGCDGASSGVRRAAGLSWRGRDLPQRWLVADVVGEVADRRMFTYTCDPARPQVDLPVPGGHRWEWLLRDVGAPADAATAARLLARDTDAHVEVVRAVPYRFGARHAGAWRAGRVLLAGDAAHTMPPFAGQGLGAGVRDAWVLAELLAAGDPSGYERLRAPHVRAMTRLSLLLGTLLQARRGAAARDLLLSSAFRTPALGPWLSRGGPRTSASGVLDLTPCG